MNYLSNFQSNGKAITKNLNFLLLASMSGILCIAIIQSAANNANNLPPTPIIASGGLLSNPLLFIETNKLYQSQLNTNTSATNTANNNTLINISTGGPNNYANNSNLNKTVNLLQQKQLLQLKFNRSSSQLASNSSSLAQQQQQQQQQRQPNPMVRLAPANYSLNNVRKRWKQMELSMGDSLGNLGLQLRTTIDELMLQQRGAGAISPTCRTALNDLIEGLAQQKLWASQMIDASARLPSGLLEGTLTELGHFDQCLGLSYNQPETTNSDNHNNNNNNKRQQQQQLTSGIGQYCSIQIKPPLIPRVRLHTICQKLPALSVNGNLTTGQLLSQNSQHFYYAGLRLGLCMPSKCQKADLQLLLTTYLAKFDLLGQVKSCQMLSGDDNLKKEFGKLDSVQQCIVSALVCLVCLVALGTIVDLFTGEASDDSKNYDVTMNNNNSSRSQRCTNHHQHQPVTTIDSESSSSGSDHHHYRHRQQQQQFDCSRLASNGKRWLYQVYRSPPGICQLHRPLSHTSSPGLQRNPLAMDNHPADHHHQQQYPMATGHLEGHILGGQFSKLHSSSRPDHLGDDECHLGDENFVPNNEEAEEEGELDGIELNGEEEEEEEEEAWIAQLERNQAKLNNDDNFASSSALGHRVKGKKMRGRKGKKGDEMKKKEKKHSLGFRALIKSFIVCFSLRTNLKLIGRHVASSRQQMNTNSIGKDCNNNNTKKKPDERHVKYNLNESCNCLSGNNSNNNNYDQTAADKATTDRERDTSQTNELADIKVIHGLRTITMVWIIFGHTIGLVNPEMMNNLFNVAQLSCSSRLLQALLNATLAVNTFFMISGLVTIVSLVRKCESANKLLLGNLNNSNHPIRDGDDPESSSVGSLSSIGSSLGSSNRCLNSSGVGALSTSGLGVGGGYRKQRPPPKRKGKVQGKKQAGSHSSSGSRRSSSDSGKKEARGWPVDFQPLAWLAMRYLRLTPAYAATIGLSILMPIFGSGPFWQESAGQLGPVCRENWWLNLIYANNFINTDKLCLIHSWYLSNDWQFFLVTIVLLTIGYKSKRLALLLLISLLLGSSAATFALTVSNDFPPTIVSTSPAVAERWLFIHSLYYKPWPHLPSYLIGLLTGYMLLIKERIKLTRATRTLSWIIFTMLALALLNSIYPWNMGLQVEPLLTGLHSATFRTLWATCCAWLVFALATKPQTTLAKLFGWHGFQVSSRLTYCVYLVHPLIIYYHFGTLRERMDSSVYGQFHRFIATLGLSYLFALLLSLMVESPSIQLQRLIHATIKRSSGGNSVHQSDSRRGMPPGGRHRNCSTCSGGTNDSWIGTSSFGEQSSANGSNLALVAGDKLLPPYSSSNGNNNNNNNKARMMMMSGILQQQPSNTYYSMNEDSQQKLQQHQPQMPAAWATAMNDTSGAPAMDADFQRKLAQAIGRGFRIRSKLANNGAARQATSQMAQVAPINTPQVPPNTRPGQQPADPSTQAKKRLSAANGLAVPTPIVAVEKKAKEDLTPQPEVKLAPHHHQQQLQQQRSPPRTMSSNQSLLNDHQRPKKVEFSTFFLGQPPSQAIQDQSQQIAIAAANYQRRRSHDLMMSNKQANQFGLSPVGFYNKQQHLIANSNENLLSKQRYGPPAAAAALLTRSQNQLDQFNPRNGLERI